MTLHLLQIVPDVYVSPILHLILFVVTSYLLQDMPQICTRALICTWFEFLYLGFTSYYNLYLHLICLHSPRTYSKFFQIFFKCEQKIYLTLDVDCMDLAVASNCIYCGQKPYFALDLYRVYLILGSGCLSYAQELHFALDLHCIHPCSSCK